MQESIIKKLLDLLALKNIYYTYLNFLQKSWVNFHILLHALYLVRKKSKRYKIYLVLLSDTKSFMKAYTNEIFTYKSTYKIYS